MKHIVALVCLLFFSSLGSAQKISGAYCTLWTDNMWKNLNPPMSLICLQDDNTWVRVGGFPEKESPTAYYSYGSLGVASNGDVLLGYQKNGDTESDSGVVVARYNKSGGWTQLGSGLMNASDTGSSLPVTMQFGGKVFDLKGTTYFLWNQSQKGVVSSFSNNKWTHIYFHDGETGGLRYPEVTVSGDGTTAYLHFGEPTPSVWSFDGSTFTKLPAIPNADKIASLHTSVTQWNNSVVLAYDETQNGEDETKRTNITHVAVYDGQSWKSLSDGIQDGAGRDGTQPFLFTSNSELYVMYPDYTTQGRSKDNYDIRFRYRVKKWTGTAWEQVGGESDPINLVQRAEFLEENGTVVISIIQPAPIGGFRQMALRWQDGKFDYLGGLIRSFPNLSGLVFRPGALIHVP